MELGIKSGIQPSWRGMGCEMRHSSLQAQGGLFSHSGSVLSLSSASMLGHAHTHPHPCASSEDGRETQQGHRAERGSCSGGASCLMQIHSHGAHTWDCLSRGSSWWTGRSWSSGQAYDHSWLAGVCWPGAKDLWPFRCHSNHCLLTPRSFIRVPTPWGWGEGEQHELEILAFLTFQHVNVSDSDGLGCADAHRWASRTSATVQSLPASLLGIISKGGGGGTCHLRAVQVISTLGCSNQLWESAFSGKSH